MPNHVLITAAMGFEERPIAEGLARAGNRSLEVIRTGVGADAGVVLRSRFNDRSRPFPTLVISSGLAGIELSGVPLGSWVLGTSVHAGDTRATLATEFQPIEKWLVSAELAFTLASYRSATEVVQVDHELEIKRGAVDMESYSLAQACKETKIRFAILRLISDTPDAPLPKAIGAFVRVTTEKSLSGKFHGAISGLRETIADPKAMGRFVSESPRLSKKLTHDWEKLAKKGGPHF